MFCRDKFSTRCDFRVPHEHVLEGDADGGEMQVSIVEDSETAVGFGSNVANFDTWERDMGSLMADGDDEEVRADGFVVGRVGGVWDL